MTKIKTRQVNVSYNFHETVNWDNGAIFDIESLESKLRESNSTRLSIDLQFAHVEKAHLGRPDYLEAVIQGKDFNVSYIMQVDFNDSISLKQMELETFLGNYFVRGAHISEYNEEYFFNQLKQVAQLSDAVKKMKSTGVQVEMNLLDEHGAKHNINDRKMSNAIIKYEGFKGKYFPNKNVQAALDMISKEPTMTPNSRAEFLRILKSGEIQAVYILGSGVDSIQLKDINRRISTDAKAYSKSATFAAVHKSGYVIAYNEDYGEVSSRAGLALGLGENHFENLASKVMLDFETEIRRAGYKTEVFSENKFMTQPQRDRFLREFGENIEVYKDSFRTNKGRLAPETIPYFLKALR